MFFSRSFAAGLLIAAAEAARLTNTAQDFTGVTPGRPFTVSWADAAGPVTILLKTGPSTNLRTVSTIASGQTGTTYVWTPDTALPSGTYAIEIDDSNGPNYSVQFPISGSTAPSSSTSAFVPSASATYTTGYSSGYSSYTSVTYNATSALTSSAYATSSYASVYPTNSANFSSTGVPATSTSEPITVPSDTNSASGITSPLALVMVAIATFAMFQ